MRRTSNLEQESVPKSGVIQQKWGEALKAGFQVVPNVLIRAQNQLGLDSVDVVVLLNLLSHWWEKNDRPFISPARIAKRMRVTTRTVERHLKDLERKEFIRRYTPKRTADGIYIRHYDLQPLAEKLAAASRYALQLRAQQPQFSKGLNRESVPAKVPPSGSKQR